MIALLAVAIVVLTILAVHLSCLARDEQRSQQRRHPKWIEDRDAKFTYHHGRTYYGDKYAARRKQQAERVRAAKRKQADAKVINMAAHRRRA